jgi:tetratricopeptide (TPR) repeat protein
MGFGIYSLIVPMLILFTVGISAQGRGTAPTSTPRVDMGSGSIHGKVVLPDGSPVNTAVRVSLQNFRGVLADLFTDNQGQFDITKLVPGAYTLQIEADRLRYDVAVRQVQVFRGMPANEVITLRLKLGAKADTPTGETVSVNELGDKVPAKARKEFERASKLAAEGKSAEAIEHLRSAIALYPDFVMAHNDLGAQLLEQGDLDEAAEELHRAIELNPKAFNPFLNLGIVLIRQHKFSEAAETLKTAVSLSSNSPAARLYLGEALLGTNNPDGAEHEFRSAYTLGGPAYALSLFYLGQIYMNKGERINARKAFEAYLHDAPNGTNAAEAHKLINMLQ